MPVLPNIDLSAIRPIALNLPTGRYLGKLVEVEKHTAKKSRRPCLKWWWEITHEPYKGEQVAYYTGDGSKESHHAMNRLLNKVLEVLGLEDSADVNIKKLKRQRVILVVEKNKKGWTEIVSILPSRNNSYR